METILSYLGLALLFVLVIRFVYEVEREIYLVLRHFLGVLCQKNSKA